MRDSRGEHCNGYLIQPRRSGADRAARQLARHVRDEHIQRRVRRPVQDRVAAAGRGGVPGHHGPHGDDRRRLAWRHPADAVHRAGFPRRVPGDGPPAQAADAGGSHRLDGQPGAGRADASGLSYRRNRYYDANSGRFTQEDPIGIAGGLNV